MILSHVDVWLPVAHSSVSLEDDFFTSWGMHDPFGIGVIRNTEPILLQYWNRDDVSDTSSIDPHLEGSKISLLAGACCSCITTALQYLAHLTDVGH